MVRCGRRLVRRILPDSGGRRRAWTGAVRARGEEEKDSATLQELVIETKTWGLTACVQCRKCKSERQL